MHAVTGLDTRPVATSGVFGVMSAFVDAARQVDSMAALRDLIEQACRDIGLRYFAITHHIRFGQPSADKVRLSNYPVEWLAVVREQVRRVDPILRAAERTSAGFRWDEVGRIVALSELDHAHLRRAAAHNLVNGITIPNHVPGEAFGSASFATAGIVPLTDSMIPAAQALGTFAFEAARRLLAEAEAPSHEFVRPAPLNERQHDCLVLAARGKSDTVIAELLALSAKTLNYHLERAKLRYAVATRQQLIVRALYQSELTYAEVLA